MNNENIDNMSSASKKLETISTELNAIKYKLNVLNENMKNSIKGKAGEYLTNQLVPYSIKKSSELSETSLELAKRLNILLENETDATDRFFDI